MARNKYPEETVKLILDVSTKMFCEKGYDNTSLQDIINETKLSKGAIYHHFDSKEDILKAIFQRIGNENAVIFAKIRDNDSLNGLEQMYEIVVPEFVEPVLEQGIKDKSLEIENSHEIAEVIMVLSNVWLNPLVEMTDKEGMEKRCNTFNALLNGIGIDTLLDEETISAFIQFCK